MKSKDNEETYRKCKEKYSNNTYKSRDDKNSNLYAIIKSANTNTINEILENIRELNGE